MQITTRIVLGLSSSVFLLSGPVRPQTRPQVKRIQADWQTFRSSRIAGNGAVYPPLAITVQVEGSVRIDFVVATDGTTKELMVLSGHPLLVPSVIDAVRSWRFEPTVLDGTPVEVETIAVENFFLTGHSSATFLAPFRKNAEKHPNDPKAHKTLGQELLSVGEAKEAAEEFQKAIALEPQEARSYFGLGAALTSQGSINGAIAEY